MRTNRSVVLISLLSTTKHTRKTTPQRLFTHRTLVSHRSKHMQKHEMFTATVVYSPIFPSNKNLDTIISGDLVMVPLLSIHRVRDNSLYPEVPLHVKVNR